MFNDDQIQELFRRTIYSECDKTIQENSEKLKTTEEEIKRVRRELDLPEEEEEEDLVVQGRDEEGDAVPGASSTATAAALQKKVSEQEATALAKDEIVDELGRFLDTLDTIKSKLDPVLELSRMIRLERNNINGRSNDQSCSKEGAAQKMADEIAASGSWTADFAGPSGLLGLADKTLPSHVPSLLSTQKEVSQLVATLLVEVYEAQQLVASHFPLLLRSFSLWQSGQILEYISSGGKTGRIKYVFTGEVVESILVPAFIPRSVRFGAQMHQGTGSSSSTAFSSVGSVATSSLGERTGIDFSEEDQWGVVHYCFWHRFDFKRELFRTCSNIETALSQLYVEERLLEIKESGGGVFGGMKLNKKKRGGGGEIVGLKDVSLDFVMKAFEHHQQQRDNNNSNREDNKKPPVVAAGSLLEELSLDLALWYPIPEVSLDTLRSSSSSSNSRGGGGNCLALTLAAALGAKIAVRKSDDRCHGKIQVSWPWQEGAGGGGVDQHHEIREKLNKVTSSMKTDFFLPVLDAIQQKLVSSAFGLDAARIGYLLLYLPLSSQLEWLEKELTCSAPTTTTATSFPRQEIDSFLEAFASGLYRILLMLESSATLQSTASVGTAAANGSAATGVVATHQYDTAEEQRALDALLDPEGKPKMSLSQVETICQKRGYMIQAMPPGLASSVGPGGQALYAVQDPLSNSVGGGGGGRELSSSANEVLLTFYLDGGIMFMKKRQSGGSNKFKEVVKLSQLTNLLA